MLDDIHPHEVARLRLESWREVSAWLDYAAAEFVADEATRGYLHHISECVRDEADRRYAAAGGFTVSVEAPTAP